MIGVKEMIESLQKYPSDALCYAYEGEVIGVVVVDKYHKELGVIKASEIDSIDKEE
jgi:hypothetical protein